MKLAQLNHQYQRIIRQSYPDLGQSIAALNIQLQAAYKLWNLDPVQAMGLLHEAYSLSSTLLQDIRKTVKTLNSPHPNSKIQAPKSYEDSLTSRR
ncbi:MULTISPECIES: histidine kinase dimerization/phosphoacceptor domain-containing protein [Leptolyngbya]|uniref:histidine kinase dimerization/phosphoacceptor domain-containing protein n=1 Tax=Leptolyngbya TaxID=47251 RepID=UPI001688D13A|nr:histidine kinase dimerization/phosphoacceptor domain-containing protein [Leptolyngbya sp. FACHB-1624]MBD1858016.1 histidine kinase dimerization/phosphoacceptor domain-containing protein [Leptolyngbya sp. FACHB-1624]